MPLTDPARAARSCAGALAAMAALAGCSPAVEVPPGGPVADWPAYGADAAGTRYSPLEQITPDNVAALEPAWTYHTGDLADGSTTNLPTSFQNTPIFVNDTLYVCSPRNRVIALDPETGAERWVYRAEQDTEGMYIMTCRGVSFWEEPRPVAGASCQRRLFMGTLGAELIALDADTGRRCEDFGQRGVVDLEEGIGSTHPGEYAVTSPPAIVGDRLITGTLVLDNVRIDAPGGVVRAYDVRTGERLWAWDPIPPGSPLVPGHDGHAARYVRGTTNAWSIFSVDAERQLVFVPTGNTAPDYWGGKREGLDYYSSSVVALDATSGRVVWHFQAVHHDIWDYDTPSQPALFEFPGPDGPVPALAQATKMGHIFFLNRVTGEPIFPVEERPVPQGAAQGESLSPTQPFPTRPAPIHPAALSPDDAFGFTFWDRAACRELISGLRSEGLFTPPSEQGSVSFPSYMGGSNWGSVAVDPGRGLLFANTSRVATSIRLIPRATYDAAVARGAGDEWEPSLGTPYALERAPLLSPLGAPCNPPPWGALSAIDLATGELRWEVPLGTTRGLAPWPIWLELGTPNLGGPIATAGGLVFIGAATDGFLRAFDAESGEELWRGALPAGGQATPMTYRRENGRQYVVIAAGGHGMLPSKLGDAVVAFALP